MLTIDDISFSSNHVTCSILNYLQQQQIPCTLFVLGQSLLKSESENWKQIIKNNRHLFEVANHGYIDTPAWKQSKQELQLHLRETQKLIHEELQVKEITFFRPGSGWVNQTVLECAKEMNYQIVLGDVYPHDAHITCTRMNVNFVRKKTQSGSILIVHDRPHTLSLLQQVIPILQRKGFQFVTLGQLTEL